jgi:DNA-binding NarL/FixJ family response regulator
MKKILIIEDNLVELENIAADLKLKRGGYSVFKASGIDKAEELLVMWNEEPFDCLIVDLNMSNEYLEGDTLKRKTNGGSLTGWVWLYHVAKPIFDDVKKSPRIIIYSEFINELKEYMESASEEEYKYYKGALTISKTNTATEPELLLKMVDELLDKRER